MTVGLAVAAVIAHDGGLDQAGAIRIRAFRQCKHRVTGMSARKGRDARDALLRGSIGTDTRDDITNQCAQLGLGHSLMSN